MGGSAATYYTLDGSDPSTYGGAFQVPATDNTSVTLWSVDALGNIESANRAT